MESYLGPDTDASLGSEQVIEIHTSDSEGIQEKNEIELLSRRQNQERTAWVLKSLSDIASYGNYNSSIPENLIQNQDGNSNTVLNYNAMTLAER